MSKKLILIFTLFTFTCTAQNLVPNPSFEDTLGCPNDNNQLDKTTNWNAFGTVDYYNACGSNGYGVPLNIAGYEFAHTGVAYVGLWVFHTVVHDFREIPNVELTDSLIANKRYNVEFYVSLADSMQYAIWNIGAYFSDSGVYGKTLSQILTYAPQITNSPGRYISNKIVWTKISGTFIANGGEKYISIGNFQDDSIIDTLFVGGSSDTGPYSWTGSYYYLDDVAVYADTTVGINEISNKEITIYPNPATNNITIESPQAAVIEITNIQGQLVKTITANTNKTDIDVSSFPGGVYIVEVKTDKGVSENKFIKE